VVLLEVERLPSAFLIVENDLALLVATKLPGLYKLSGAAMQWMQSKAMRIKTKQYKANQCKYKAEQRNAKQKPKVGNCFWHY
jgi:hypothetical protein